MFWWNNEIFLYSWVYLNHKERKKTEGKAYYCILILCSLHKASFFLSFAIFSGIYEYTISMKKSSYKGDILALLCFIMSLVRLTDKEFSFAIDTTVAPFEPFYGKEKGSIFYRRTGRYSFINYWSFQCNSYLSLWWALYA